MESIPMPMPPAPPAETISGVSDAERWSDSGDTISPDDSSEVDSESLADTKATAADVTSARVERALASACELKEKGNQKLRENDFAEACTFYGKGVKKLSKLNQKSWVDGSSSGQEVQDLQQRIRNAQLALHLNACLANLKKGSWAAAISSGSEVLKLDPSNVKGLYRRACAYRDSGRFVKAKADFLKCTELDPNNSECRRELAQLKRQELETKERDRKAFAGLFGKATGLYEDRERATRLRREAEQHELKRLQDEYEKDKARRVAAGEGAVEPFEQWREARAAETKNQPPPQNRREGVSRTAPPKKTHAASPSLDLDEDDQKIIQETKKMGYCYFNRKVDEGASNALQPSPIPLDASPSPNLASLNGSSSANMSSDSNNKSSLSTWNKAGKTYEERDVTNWASSSIRKALSGLKASWETRVNDEAVSAIVRVSTVDTLEGEAQIVILRGTKRYFYDFKIVLKWDLEWAAKSGNQQRGSCGGTLTLCDVGAGPSARTQPKTDGLYPPIEWLREACFTVGNDKASSATHPVIVREALERLKGEIFCSICLFEEDFQALG